MVFPLLFFLLSWCSYFSFIPRPGLLPALQAQDRDRIATFLISGCENGPATTLLPRRANRHLLTVWRHANGDDEQAGHMALSSDDRAALAVVDELAWHRWIRLPITLAEPCPGLLPDLLAREEPQLVAFLDSLQR